MAGWAPGLLLSDLSSLFSAISGEPLHSEGGFGFLGGDSSLSCQGESFHERLQRWGGGGGERRRESSIVSETILGLCGDIFDKVLISETVWTLYSEGKGDAALRNHHSRGRQNVPLTSELSERHPPPSLSRGSRCEFTSAQLFRLTHSYQTLDLLILSVSL